MSNTLCGKILKYHCPYCGTKIQECYSTREWDNNRQVFIQVVQCVACRRSYQEHSAIVFAGQVVIVDEIKVFLESTESGDKQPTRK